MEFPADLGVCCLVASAAQQRLRHASILECRWHPANEELRAVRRPVAAVLADWQPHRRRACCQLHLDRAALQHLPHASLCRRCWVELHHEHGGRAARARQSHGMHHPLLW